MAREFLTDAEVEVEIDRLTNSYPVKLARREHRIKYRRRQQLYTLRSFEKRGKELIAQGVTMETLDLMEAGMDEADIG